MKKKSILQVQNGIFKSHGLRKGMKKENKPFMLTLYNLGHMIPSIHALQSLDKYSTCWEIPSTLKRCYLYR